VSSDWARGSAVAAAVAVEVFLPLAFEDEPLSWGWSATGGMFDECSFATNSSRGCGLSRVAVARQRTKVRTAGALYKAGRHRADHRPSEPLKQDPHLPYSFFILTCTLD